MKTKITKKEYLQIVGLLALADKYMKIIGDIINELREIVGEKEEWGHCGDAVIDDRLRNADSLLKKLKIKRA
jgi:hypothetical protein